RELDQDRLVQMVTEEASDLVGAAYGSFAHVDQDGAPAVVLHVAPGADPDAFRDLPVRRLNEVFGPTLRDAKVICCADVRADPELGRDGSPLAGRPVVSYLAAPVVGRDGAVLGGLFFAHPEPGRFTAHHQELIAALAAQAAIAVENARLYRALRESEERARRAERRKDEFLAMLGHELRNPLAPITTALALMKMNGEQAGARERAIIERQVGHLIGLVDYLLDVSRITRGKIQLRLEPTEVSTVITSAIEMVSPLLEQRGHSLRLELPPDALLVNADPVRLAQVIANLLHNAAKYTEPGGQVSIRAARQEGQVRIVVTDTGIGIHQELLPSLFDMFIQGERSLDRSQGGLGLGLTLVKSLVALHGGEVEARSDGPGCGSEFEIRLPRLTGDVAAERPARAPRPLRNTGEVRRVLVVDDNQDAAELLGEALRAVGHDVAIAHDGPTALELAARQ